jgi:predicted ATPase/DNA-binding CsgD family transcriptional regulator
MRLLRCAEGSPGAARKTSARWPKFRARPGRLWAMSGEPAQPRPDHPGTVTFLVAGPDPSTPNARLHELLDAALAAHGSRRPGPGAGAAAVAVFTSAAEAVAAALELRAAAPPLRIALHTGEARAPDGGRLAGPAARRCQRLCEIANGGQTLLSAVTASAVAELLPAGSSLRDLGLHRLRDLSPPARVFELRDGGPAADPLPPRSLGTVPNNLPVQLTSFVGRQTELAAVQALLSGERLVTLTGAGGCGKTRLAAQVAADQAERWPEGVWWVELGAATDPAMVAELVASTVGVLVEPVRGPLRSLALQLRDRRVLLCLDNCEQVLDGAAEVAEALLRSCPEVTVLTTSREPLRVPGEAVWRVPSLAEDDALALFVERASLVRPEFTLDASGEAAVRTMCSRLDGIPLALELAAAWVRTLTPQQIEAGLDDRFALLVRSPRGVAARQQTLAASMHWSHDLLDEPDRIVFRRLAVFAGGFTLDAARAVGAGGPVGHDRVLGALGRLVDKSLVVAEHRDGEARYRLLETIRQYADGRLHEAAEAEAARDRHLDHYLAVVEAAEPDLDRDKDAWRTRLEVEHDNLRAALTWGLSAEDPGRGRRLAAGLPWLWHLHGHGHEGIAFLERAVGRAPTDRSALQARLLAGVALVADTARPLNLEFDAAQRGLAIATELGDERLRGLCLLLSAVGRFYADFGTAWELCLDALRSAEAAGDGFVTDGTKALQGIILHLRDRHEEARPLLREAADGLLRRGDRGIAATVVGYRSGGALYTGELELARRLAEQAVRLAAPLGDYHRVGTTRGVLATVQGLAGDPDAGLALMRPVLRLVEGADDDVFVPGMARVLGTLHLWRGDPDGAVHWLGGETLSTGPGAGTILEASSLPALGAALRHLGKLEEAAGALDRAVTLATTLDMPRVLADALEQQAHLAAADDPDRAADLHHEALAVRVRHRLRTFYADSLDALAALAARTGRPADAVRMIAAGDHARQAIGYPRRPLDLPGHDATVAGLRAALGDGPFAEAWTQGAGQSLDAVVAYARRARGSRGRPAVGWASLTPTELEVVRLVVEGLTNPQIGTRLFMSRGTVKAHLSHVYAKVGVANRTELATLAVARLDGHG